MAAEEEEAEEEEAEEEDTSRRCRCIRSRIACCRRRRVYHRVVPSPRRDRNAESATPAKSLSADSRPISTKVNISQESLENPWQESIKDHQKKIPQ